MFEGSHGRQFSPVQAGTGRRPRCGRMQGDTGRGADGHGRHRQSPDKDDPRGAAERGVRPNEGKDGVSGRAVSPAAGRDGEASSAQLRDAAEAPGMTARGTTSPSASDAAGEAQAVALMREMLRNMQRMEAKFEAMDAKFESKFTAMDAKFEIKFADMNAKFDHIDATVKRIETDGARMEGRMGRLEDRLARVETHEREGDTRARTMEVEMGKVQSLLAGTDKQVSSLEAQQQRAHAGMVSLQQSVTEQTVDMRGLREARMHEGEKLRDNEKAISALEQKLLRELQQQQLGNDRGLVGVQAQVHEQQALMDAVLQQLEAQTQCVETVVQQREGHKGERLQQREVLVRLERKQDNAMQSVRRVEKEQAHLRDELERGRPRPLRQEILGGPRNQPSGPRSSECASE